MKQESRLKDGTVIAPFIASTSCFQVCGLERAKQHPVHQSRRNVRVQGKGGKIRLTSKPVR
jgi:hypothetical protein